MADKLKNKFSFNNEVINKKKLQKLMSLTFHNYGVIKSSLIADKVKNLTFHYATISGISLSVEDLRVPYRKRSLIGLTTNEVDLTEQNFSGGNITIVERFQKVIDIWNNANNILKDEVLTYFRESDPLNPLYIMAFSGARGNISQVRQLVGMRGLMADPQGQIIDLPIKSNFREGLKVTEYIISSYGARKGLVDTALRTADSGYLTRRLVDVAQDIIIREEDCLTKESLSLEDLFKTYKTGLSLEDRLVGRLLAEPIVIEGQIFPRNTEIDLNLVKEIARYKIEKMNVRSSLTCDAPRSVCRKCYGWHLSYSRIIDLGEAVGILAAQSIGEPGTQLTMRTFHTGGVFSGDLTKQVRAPFAGTLKYKLKSKTSLTRTLHGEKGFNLMEAITLVIENLTGTVCSLDIPRGALLLANNGQQVYMNQIVAEIKKDNNLILEEDRRDIYTHVSGEVFLQNIKLKEEESSDDENTIKKISKTSGLIWVLYGDRYVLQEASKLSIQVGEKFDSTKTIASQTIQNKYPGILDFTEVQSTGMVNIINSSMVLEHANVLKTGESSYILDLEALKEKKSFALTTKNGESLTHGQTIASLSENTYKTDTGGIIYYSLNNQYSQNKKRRSTKNIFSGSLYWIPEETHSLNSINLIELSLKNGTFVKKGTPLLPDIFANIDGFIQIDKENEELIIKPGELYQLKNLHIKTKEKINRFVNKGDVLFKEIIVQKLSFVEFFTLSGVEYLLLRPVKTYNVPQDKGFFLSYRFFPNIVNRNAAFRTVIRIFYKDGEKIKSANRGVNLLQTFLILDIKNQDPSLKSKIEYLPKDSNNQSYSLRYSLYEQIKIKDLLNLDLKLQNRVLFRQLVKNNQYVLPKTSLAKIEILPNFDGKLVSINKSNNNTDILVLKTSSIKVCSYDEPKEKPIVKQGDLVRVGTFLTASVQSRYAGQIYKINNGQIFIRLGRPYLISEGAILRALPQTIIEKSDILATLVYDKLKTVDIVQGLPKVEEILEARKIKNGCLLSPDDGQVYLKNAKLEILKSSGVKLTLDVNRQLKVNFSNGKHVKFLEPLSDGPISPHDKLEILFNYYQQNYPVHEACKRSFKHLQLFLVNEVQRTYLSQGVEIADKHIEIIVKQMTSKVRVIYGGDTTLLPGEILDIHQAGMITKATLSEKEDPPIYKPMLLGLTKASLNSDSFISAASFQETTRVLTEAAIEGKKDWLNGLKENVIIGRLIPAGTGFNCFDNLKKVGRDTITKHLIKPANNNKLKTYILKNRLNP
jgi:DNA-directed RNA polymerase subunit beta'